MSEGTNGTKRRLFSRAQLAERWQCSTRTVARMEADGRLPPPIQLTDRIKRWDEIAIDEFERARAAS